MKTHSNMIIFKQIAFSVAKNLWIFEQPATPRQ